MTLFWFVLLVINLFTLGIWVAEGDEVGLLISVVAVLCCAFLLVASLP